MTAIKDPPKDAYSLILDAIDAGIYRPGHRLVESELADRFGVSRTPIREALQRLETQSMLVRDGRSMVVASLDHHQLAELYAVRAELEGLAARLADRVVVINGGRVIADGPPLEALRPEVLREVFGLDARWIEADGAPLLAMRRAV